MRHQVSLLSLSCITNIYINCHHHLSLLLHAIASCQLPIANPFQENPQDGIDQIDLHKPSDWKQLLLECFRQILMEEDHQKAVEGRRQSNLDSFLRSVTPTVSSTKNCKCEINSYWHTHGKANDCIECFTLGDLWECYNEWSAYGVGIPVVLDDGEILMQYFAPCLSAISIATNTTVLWSLFRSSGDENARMGLESVLSFSDESESDRLSRSTSNNSSGWGESNSDEFPDLAIFPSPSTVDNKLGQVYIQYFEYDSPFTRIPFSDKIAELGRKHPGLMTLKNTELSPASWMAVAWYPIYHIPSHRTAKDFSTMFLTYHTLSSCFQDDEQVDNDSDEQPTKQNMEKRSGCVSLEPFGMASYKMAGDVWVNGVDDYEKFITLQSAADSWLKQLGSYHHDFNFFLAHSSGSLPV